MGNHSADISNADPVLDERGRRLYRVGDSVRLDFQIYPGPRPFSAIGKVVELLSPTYYLIEYTNFDGQVKRGTFIRSQLP